MKKYNFLTTIVAIAGMFIMTSCGDDFLSAESAGKNAVGSAATEEVILSNIVGAYQILLFDSYADNNYNAVLLMSDLRSDDLYKGGESAADQEALFALATYTSTPANNIPGLWRIYYSGIARVNGALISCENAVNVSPAKLDRYKAECHFLRAYYTHLLWKFWGNIPFFKEPLAAPYLAPQYNASEIYAFIMEDLAEACKEGVLPMKTTGSDLGRASRSAALMLKARVVMYQKDTSKYGEITNDMATIITNGSYDLFENFDAMWNDENEFCKESIFESNQLPSGKTWDSGWQGYGTNLPAFISPNELTDPAGIFKGGWGFAPVREEAYTLYENGDLRRDGSINCWIGKNYGDRFQDTGYYQRKYGARVGYNPFGDTDLNYCNNLRIFRFAETLLNYAELVTINAQAEKQGVSAQTCLDRIRKRAFGTDAIIPLNAENIKNERHKEFVGEGMRFWDLIRWGEASAKLTENITRTTPGAKKSPVTWNWSRTFTEEKKYLPIPEVEMNATKGSEYELKQNPGW